VTKKPGICPVYYVHNVTSITGIYKHKAFVNRHLNHKANMYQKWSDWNHLTNSNNVKQR